MKVVQINVTCGTGSTGKICLSISKLLTQNGIENYILYSSGESDYPLGIKYTSNYYIKLQALKSRVFGNYGFDAKHATKILINELKHIKPDVVHLHNIHGHNCNLEMLFSYLKKIKSSSIGHFTIAGLLLPIVRTLLQLSVISGRLVANAVRLESSSVGLRTEVNGCLKKRKNCLAASI